ncbi:MAG: hypothetical protein SGBAC_005391, partial [Bacillariaceae sp.]
MSTDPMAVSIHLSELRTPKQKGALKEFVSVKIIGATEESFGNSVGITGDFKTGKTLARDGVTVLDDFNELGLEWQVLPSDGKLFHEMSSAPQFPNRRNVGFRSPLTGEPLRPVQEDDNASSMSTNTTPQMQAFVQRHS